MQLYYFSVFVVFVLLIYGVVVFSMKSGNKSLMQHMSWMNAHKIKIGVLGAVLFIAVNLAFYIPIKKAFMCSFKGYEHSVETQYWLLSGNCNYLGKNGEWIPIWKLIGIADGMDDKNKSDDINNSTQK